jgi:spermidine/putrescine transport system ATP-binding protein
LISNFKRVPAADRGVRFVPWVFFLSKEYLCGMNKNVLIQLNGISKAFDGETVLDHINLEIQNKEFITLLGPSGCGKTTTLRIIGGFETPDEGDVFFDGKRINDIPPYKRQVNTVFQRYALFPHLNVFDNIAFGLRIQKCPDAQIKEKVKEMLALVNLRGFERRKVSTLSGGQQQRVAIARALVNQPKVLLLDEPLAALDLKLRKDMQNELKNIQHQTGITFIYVTHDQEEALSMSDTVVVMAHGKIQQIGTPTDIYNEPINAFVADFIGESNIVDGVMLADYRVKLAGHTFDCVDGGFAVNEPVDVVIRPEDVDVVPVEKGMLSGLVTGVTFKGVHHEIIVDVKGSKWMIQTTDFVAEGETIGLSIDPDAFHIMKKSEFSGMFGDYSSFSDELDKLSDATEEIDEE